MIVKNQKDKLNDLFKTYPQVLAAYFYGSQVTGHSNKESDLDLAVVVDNVLELGFGQMYLQVNQIIKNMEVDLRIVTDQNSPTYIFQILKNGQLVYERDALQRVRFEANTLSEYYDGAHIRKIYDSYLNKAFN